MNGVVNALLVNNALRCSVRKLHANADLLANVGMVKNRNPRNLELLRIARKPSGFHLEKPGREYWHSLQLSKTSRRVTADIHHFLNGKVISVSTNEWAINKHLYRTTDTVAYINLARVLAQRCLESGVLYVASSLEPTKGGKVELFLTELEKEGIHLKEPTRYKNPNPWDMERPEKPWENTVG